MRPMSDNPGDFRAQELRYTGRGEDGREFVPMIPSPQMRPSEALLLEHESIPADGQSMFERVMLMVMAITTSVASIVFIVISIRAYLFLIEVAEALESWRNQLGSI